HSKPQFHQRKISKKLLAKNINITTKNQSHQHSQQTKLQKNTRKILTFTINKIKFSITAKKKKKNNFSSKNIQFSTLKYQFCLCQQNPFAS
ncbi:MAG: hypothetical protein J6M05_01815, partial [Cardiobacteriaceae bacterium]|nr:hypothetical protein [Cardiobacteriaceae bacterium]